MLFFVPAVELGDVGLGHEEGDGHEDGRRGGNGGEAASGERGVEAMGGRESGGDIGESVGREVVGRVFGAAVLVPWVVELKIVEVVGGC